MILCLSLAPDLGFREAEEEDIMGQASSYSAIHGGRVRFTEVREQKMSSVKVRQDNISEEKPARNNRLDIYN